MGKFGKLFAVVTAVALGGVAYFIATTLRSDAPVQGVLPRALAPFKGVIGRTADESTPDFPKLAKAPQGAPNVLLVLTDDVGFAGASTFGGPVPTPNLDRLAANGLRYNRFHTTAMCSPTRASLLTGRNSHAVSTGTVLDMTTGFPGYWSMIPKSAATVAEILRLSGYNTAFFGKHHNTPAWQKSAAGPFDLWPTGLGFEYFYGFLGGETDQWSPALYRGTTPADPHAHGHDPAYILDRDLADDAIHWLHNQKAAGPDKPFFLYFAPGSAHAPHQAPQEWIAKFRGQFDQGWDKVREESFARQKANGAIPADTELTPRPEIIKAWDALTADERKVYARLMEVFAGMLAYQDFQIGRMLDELERMGQSDNTLIIFVEGDNGGSPEGGADGASNYLAAMAGGVREDIGWKLSVIDELGGPDTHANFPIGWAWATDTPFQWMKTFASHLGGTRNGLVISWPARLKEAQIKAGGGWRTQFHHVIDVMPTILEAVGITMPTVVNGIAQQPVDGVSMLYTFDDAGAAGRRTTQYFEMLGSLGIYHDGWMASSTPNHFPGRIREKSNYDYKWELYNLDADFSQAKDLAHDQPDKLKEMTDKFWSEAARYKVLPIDDAMNVPRALAAAKAYGAGPPNLTFWGPDIRLADESTPPINGRSFSLTAEVVIPDGGANGVIAASGGRGGGWSFYLKDGKPVAYLSISLQPNHQFTVTSEKPLPPGKATVRYDFEYDGGGPGRGGLMRILVDGTEVAQGRFARTLLRSHDLAETFDTGRDTGAPVSLDYQNQGRFTGELKRIDVNVR